MAAKRERYGAGPGRPARGPRCACGKMSAKRAAQMRHRCSATAEGPEAVQH